MGAAPCFFVIVLAIYEIAAHTIQVDRRPEDLALRRSNCAELILLSPENAISTARDLRASTLYLKKGFPHDDGNREVV
jgi:hypothetical protein